eukprot:11558519-Karenia_brevis.AAC.1
MSNSRVGKILFASDKLLRNQGVRQFMCIRSAACCQDEVGELTNFKKKPRRRAWTSITCACESLNACKASFGARPP